MARKSQIIELLKTELQNSGNFAQVYRHFKFLDQINDFPTICLNASPEDKDHLESTVLRGIIDLDLRGYIKSDNAIAACDTMIQNVETIVSSIVNPLIESIRVRTVSSDEGLFEPYGVIDMKIQIQYSNL